MRVLWIVNCPIGPFARKYGIKSSSGVWLDAALHELRSSPVELFVAASYPVPQNETVQEDGVTYVLMAGRLPGDYVVDDAAVRSWKDLYREVRPDLIQIWGSEYLHALAALKAKPEGVKALLYIQGVMGSVAEHYYGGIPREALEKNTSVFERVAGKTIFQEHRRISTAARVEAENAALADGIVYETEWSRAFFQKNYAAKTFYRHKLPINPTFFRYRWAADRCVPHSIFTPASDYPLKGVHFLLRALPKIKEAYPDVKLRIPGAVIQKNMGLKARIKLKAYRRYLRKLIEEHQLWENVEFTGVLTSPQMAEQMAAANVFVCTSAIENHSSTLREAMIVGTPCITTRVGGIPEYFTDRADGIMVPPLDEEQLAESILSLFSDPAAARQYSENARRDIQAYYRQAGDTLPTIYEKTINEQRA